MPPVEPPEDFGSLDEWRHSGDPDSVGHRLVTDWVATWETGYVVDDAGIRDFDEWAGVRVDCTSDNEWSVTISYEDGTSDTIELGRDGWDIAWDLYDIADSDRNDLDAERGDIDYTAD